jgi:hypothetical protein
MMGTYGMADVRYAEPGDLTCSLLLTSSGAITAGEPVIARVEIVNRSSETIRIWSGGTFLDVYGSDGTLLASMPRPRNVMDFMYSTRDLAPGESYSKLLIVTGLYQFATPGTYGVRVQQLGLPREPAVLCENTVSIQVLPYSSSQLEAACDELFMPMRRHSSFGDVPLSTRAKALYSVRDDVVLPYLDWMAREWGDRYACRAMRRVRTSRAEALLAALTTRTDRVGDAARQALEMPLTSTSWDVEGE